MSICWLSNKKNIKNKIKKPFSADIISSTCTPSSEPLYLESSYLSDTLSYATIKPNFTENYKQPSLKSTTRKISKIKSALSALQTLWRTKAVVFTLSTTVSIFFMRNVSNNGSTTAKPALSAGPTSSQSAEAQITFHDH